MLDPNRYTRDVPPLFSSFFHFVGLVTRWSSTLRGMSWYKSIDKQPTSCLKLCLGPSYLVGFSFEPTDVSLSWPYFLSSIQTFLCFRTFRVSVFMSLEGRLTLLPSPCDDSLSTGKSRSPVRCSHRLRTSTWLLRTGRGGRTTSSKLRGVRLRRYLVRRKGERNFSGK